MSYELFRNVLTMNLCQVIPQDKLDDVLKAVDMSASDFDVQRKPMSIIATGNIPEVVKMYLGTRIVANLSKTTIEQYRYKLFHFFKAVSKPYCDITPNDIRMYLYTYKIEHKASDNYIDNIRRVLNSFFNWLVVNEYGIKNNPCSKVEKVKYQEKKREPMSLYELELFRFNANNIREKALIDIFFSTGMRVQEVADAKLSDVNWNDRSIRVRHGKGNKERYVYFNAEAEVSFRAYLKTRTDSNDCLFASDNAPHQAITKRTIESIIRKIALRSGIHVSRSVVFERIQTHQKLASFKFCAKQQFSEVRHLHRTNLRNDKCRSLQEVHSKHNLKHLLSRACNPYSE